MITSFQACLCVFTVVQCDSVLCVCHYFDVPMYYIHCVYCTLYSVQCTMYTIHCIVYSVHYVHYTLYTIHCIVYIARGWYSSFTRREKLYHSTLVVVG